MIILTPVPFSFRASLLFVKKFYINYKLVLVTERNIVVKYAYFIPSTSGPNSKSIGILDFLVSGVK